MGFLAIGLLAACGGTDPGSDALAPGVPLPFEDLSVTAGLEFVHVNGMSGRLYLAEIMGSGAGLLDFDGDGDLDVYLVQGTALVADDSGDSGDSAGTVAPRDRLFRNQLVETGELGFVDVTDRAGIVATGYGMGVAVGDYDRDGRVDLYVTNLGSNQMLRNRGDGTFEDRTAMTGTDDPRWSTSATFVDHDRDGWPDLFVAGYVEFSVELHTPCRGTSGREDYCMPGSYRPLADRLFRNRGDGTFEDISDSSGIAAQPGAGLGVVATDFNADGRTDLFVANDGMPNRLWIQTAAGRFEDQALIAGCAFNREGKPEASMGVNAADLDGDGSPDLFLTHLAAETNTFYRNDGQGRFTDATAGSGLGAASHAFTGFGTAAADFDGDGRLDLAVANGAVTRIERLVARGEPFPLQQRNQLFRNTGEGRFEEWNPGGNAAFVREEVSRGLAVGDLDNDGDPDLLLTNNNGAARLLVNAGNPGGNWLGLRLIDPDGGDAVDTRVELRLDDGSSQHRRGSRDGSYLSSNDPRVLFGVGPGRAVIEVRVSWPDGAIESWDRLEAGRYHEIRRGSGRGERE